APAARAVSGAPPSCGPTLPQPEGPRGAAGGRGGQAGSRDCRLSVGDAAVVGREALRREDAEALRREPLTHTLEEPAVLEAAAREHDGARPPLPGHARAGLGPRGAAGVLEGRRDRPPEAPGPGVPARPPAR